MSSITWTYDSKALRTPLYGLHSKRLVFGQPTATSLPIQTLPQVLMPQLLLVMSLIAIQSMPMTIGQSTSLGQMMMLSLIQIMMRATTTKIEVEVTSQHQHLHILLYQLHLLRHLVSHIPQTSLRPFHHRGSTPKL